MKFKEVGDSSKFKPITVELTFESVDELCNMWNRLEIADDIITEHSVSGVPIGIDNCYDLWRFIDNKLVELGVKIR